MEQNRSRERLSFIAFFAVLIVVTSYLMTAYFIHAWPFITKNIADDSQDISQIVSDIGAEGYEISTGKRTEFDGFSIVFPKDWVLMNTGGNSAILGLNESDMDVSVSVTRIETQEELPENAEDVKVFLLENIDSWYGSADISSVTSGGSRCFLFSGSFTRYERDDGMITLICPDGDSLFFMVTGLFPMEGGSGDVVEDIIATFRLETQ